MPLVNRSSTPTETFAISDDIQITLGDRLQALIHSHPDGRPVPSAADLQQQQAMAIPWGIVAVNKGGDGDLIASAVVWFGEQAPPESGV